MENKTGKYFKYAIGEIVLVVIGILIALQINNWNEERLKERQIKACMIQIQNELIQDLKESIQVIHYLERRDMLIEKVLTNQVSKTEYSTNSILRTFLGGSISFNIIPDGFKNLIKIIDEPTFKNQELLVDLKNLYVNEYEKLDYVSKWFRDYVHEYNNYVSENFDWYSTQDRLTSNDISEGNLNYLLNSPIYKNRVARYRNLGIGNFRTKVYAIQIKMAALYKSLAYETGYKPKEQVINSYFNSPLNNMYEPYLGKYKSNDRDREIALFVENDSLKIEAPNGIFYVVEGSGNRLQRFNTIVQYIFENDSTLLQMNSRRTRWKLIK